MPLATTGHRGGEGGRRNHSLDSGAARSRGRSLPPSLPPIGRRWERRRRSSTNIRREGGDLDSGLPGGGGGQNGERREEDRPVWRRGVLAASHRRFLHFGPLCFRRRRAGLAPTSSSPSLSKSKMGLLLPSIDGVRGEDQGKGVVGFGRKKLVSSRSVGRSLAVAAGWGRRATATKLLFPSLPSNYCGGWVGWRLPQCPGSLIPPSSPPSPLVLFLSPAVKEKGGGGTTDRGKTPLPRLPLYPSLQCNNPPLLFISLGGKVGLHHPLLPPSPSPLPLLHRGPWNERRGERGRRSGWMGTGGGKRRI